MITIEWWKSAKPEENNINKELISIQFFPFMAGKEAGSVHVYKMTDACINGPLRHGRTQKSFIRKMC